LKGCPDGEEKVWSRKKNSLFGEKSYHFEAGMCSIEGKSCSAGTGICLARKRVYSVESQGGNVAILAT